MQQTIAITGVKNSNIIDRIKAFAVDYLIIILYAALLFGISILISKIFHLDVHDVDPVTGELTGFITLTFPVILYFTLSENSRYEATVGKRKFQLYVTKKDKGKAGFMNLLVRNCIKFLPWELAHFFIYRLINFTSAEEQVPGYILTGLIASQALAIIYLLFILFTKNNRSLYELISGTMVIKK